MDKARDLRIRHPQGRSEQPDRPRGRRAAPERAVAVDRHRRRARAGAAVLGLAALRAAPSRLSARADAARAGDRRRDQPAPAARDRDAARPAADREARDRAAGHGGAGRRRCDRDRARDAGQSRRRSRSSRRAEHEAVGSGVAEQAFNWRPTIERRVVVAAVVLALWTLGDRGAARSICRSSATTSSTRAPSGSSCRHVDAAGQARRDLRSPRPAARLQRRRRHHLRRPATKSRTPRSDGRGAVRRARRLLARRSRRRSLSGSCRQRAFAYVRRRVSPAEARKVAALKLDGHRLHEGEPALLSEQGARRRTLLGYVGLDNVGLERHRSRLRQGRPRTRRQAHRPDRRAPAARSAASSARPTSGGSLELTIDEQLQYIVERELRAGVEEKRADGGTRRRHGSADRRRSWRWPTGRRSTPTRSTTSSEPARRNRAVQDIYEPGSTFKVVTVVGGARRARHAGRRDDRHQPRRHPASAGRVIDEFEGHNYGVLSFTDVIVKSSNVGAIKIGLEARPRAARAVRAPLRLRPADLARFSRREPGHRLEPGQAERQRAGVDVDGLSGRRDAAADGGGDERGGQRRHLDRAARRARRHAATACARASTPKVDAPRHQPGDGGRRCCRFSKRSSSAARASSRGFPATPSPARPARPTSS